MKIISQPIIKRDAMQVLTGKPVYMDDMVPDDCLIIKLLRSPHAHAIVEEIDTSEALLLDGIEAVFTWKDVDQNQRRFTAEGESYPETGPYDRLILDRHVRYAGDVVAIVAGENRKVVEKALKLIKVKYKILEPILDFHTAKDNKIIIHPEDNWEALVPQAGGDKNRNLCAHQEESFGDIENAFKHCDIIVDETYHTKACQQAPMETFRTYCDIDTYGRLHVFTSTQVVFHCKRIIANALNISKSLVRVSKPRVGGGFGAKGSTVSELYPAFVTWKTKKASKIVFTREESQTASSPRHEMEIRVRLGAKKNGKFKAFEMYVLSNTGAYGDHGPTTAGLAIHIPPSVYRDWEAYHLVTDVVYTNKMASGAYRGYGATQGHFAFESAVNELAHKLNMDPFDIREINRMKEGCAQPTYFDGEINTSCSLGRCLKKTREMMDWDNKYPSKQIDDHTIRCVGMAAVSQTTAISKISVGGATLRIGDDGTYALSLSSGDIGSGSDTSLSQIAAEVLQCDIGNISVHSADTDTAPYDTGSYASATAFATGKATELAALKLKDRILKTGVALLKNYSQDNCDIAELRNNIPLNANELDKIDTAGFDFDGKQVFSTKDNSTISIATIAAVALRSNASLEITETFCPETTPPPFLVGAVELEVDTQTGSVKVLEYDAAVDCGTPLNPSIVKAQVEGAAVQGLGMALTEQVTYDKNGKMAQNSFMQYKIPTRLDVGKLNVSIESSYEKSGPFGAKGVGEVGVNAIAPAIADALYHATGFRFTTLPILPESVALKKNIE